VLLVRTRPTVKGGGGVPHLTSHHDTLLIFDTHFLLLALKRKLLRTGYELICNVNPTV